MSKKGKGGSRSPVNPQRKEKKRKEKKSIPPTLESVKGYFKKNGYSEKSAVKAFNYYEAGNWKDSSGKPVISWKQKMRGVWFKDENKIQQPTSNPPQQQKSIVHLLHEAEEKYKLNGMSGFTIFCDKHKISKEDRKIVLDKCKKKQPDTKQLTDIATKKL